MTLGGEVVYLVGADLLNDSDDIGCVGEISIVEHEVDVFFMRILKKMVYTGCVEDATPALYSVDFVPFRK